MSLQGGEVVGIAADGRKLSVSKAHERNELSSRERSQRNRQHASVGERSRSEKATCCNPSSVTFRKRQN